MLAAILAAIAALIGAIFYHRRAVITAEQRGRLDEISKHNAVTKAVQLTREAGAAARIAEGIEAAQAAERSTPTDPVIDAEVVMWTKPPRDPS